MNGPLRGREIREREHKIPSRLASTMRQFLSSRKKAHCYGMEGIEACTCYDLSFSDFLCQIYSVLILLLFSALSNITTEHNTFISVSGLSFSPNYSLSIPLRSRGVRKMSTEGSSIWIHRAINNAISDWLE